jgi:REP element-mobilizing transposase RayT
MRRRLADAEVLLQRQPLRLRDYDYAQPAIYFVTTNTHARICRFGEVADGVMRLNKIGRIVHERWMAIPAHHPAVELDAFIVMPNHVHGIIRILSNGRGEAGLAPTSAGAGASAGSLGAIIGSLKAGVSRRVAAIQPGRHLALWQSGYQDHIVRTDGELERIRRYIAANPANWPSDVENPDRTAGARQASPPQEPGSGERRRERTR